jgi:biotin operon repressor
MFRNGGPIKEGIMSGMQDRPGYNLAGRVGGFFTNLFKKPAAQATGTTVASQAAKKPSVVSAAGSKLKELFTGSTKTIEKQGPTIVKPGGNVYSKGYPGGKVGSQTIGPGTATTTGNLQPFTPGGPTNPNIYAAAQRVLVPITTGGGKVLSAAKPYSTAITIGGIGAYSLLNDDGTQKTIEQIKSETGASETEIASAINEANKGGGEGGVNRDAEIEANRKRYYKLMGIDKMNKDAVYNTLIDASNQIREGGTIKDQLKSGSLASGVINALSKNLDKSVDLKKQIDAAILKGEITKDINKQKDQLDAEYKRTVIDKAKSDMAGGTMNQIINDRKAKGIVTSGQDLFKLAVQTGNASNIKEIISDKAVSNYFKDNPTKTAADFFQEEVVLKLAEEGKSVTPGDYIVGENILRVTADGKIQFVF